jgi:hypothetical protein
MKDLSPWSIETSSCRRRSPTISRNKRTTAGRRRRPSTPVPIAAGCCGSKGNGSELAFRCHVGRAYAPEILLSQKSEEFESALWASLRLLKEKATPTRQLAHRTRTMGNGGNPAAADRIAEQADLDERYVRIIPEVLEATPYPADQAEVIARALDEGE